MQNYILAIFLPASIKKQLASLCFGPQQIRWIDQDHLYYIISSLGNLSDIELDEIIQSLDTLFFSSFSFSLKDISCKYFKGNGIIGLQSKENPELLNLHKIIDLSIRELKIKKSNPLPFSVILGYFEKISIERLNDYLISNASFKSHPIEVPGIVLLRTWQSTKGAVYEEVAFFPSSQIATGED